jgi:hypothetical protein
MELGGGGCLSWGVVLKSHRPIRRQMELREELPPCQEGHGPGLAGGTRCRRS